MFALLVSLWLVIGFLTSAPSSSSLSTCTPEQLADVQPLDDYVLSDVSGFVRIEDGRFSLNAAPYPVYGVNYYPSRYPWRRFIAETDLESLRTELELLRDTGFNTLRIFLWNDALFNCPGNGGVQNVQNFEQLDRLIHEMAHYDFRLIVTLNDLPDLTNFPLYNDYTYVREQTAFIINRYRDEPAILAWDLRNEGDIDYGSRELGFGRFQHNQILQWLESTSTLVRSLDGNHLITAGWMDDAHATAPYVDFISFHHWWSATDLLQRIDTIRLYSDLPILLEEFGYSTFDRSPERQAQQIQAVLEAVESTDLVGWMIWTAFDFPLDRTCLPAPCMSIDSWEHRFGIWNTDYTPKPAVAVIQAFLNE